MKRTKLLKACKATAARNGVTWELLREGSSHSIYLVGTVQVVVPRHNDINELTARGILDTVAKTT